MAFRLEDFVRILDRYGISEVLMPFILIFTLVYASLKKIKFMDENKGVPVTISLVMALVVIILHVTRRYPAGRDVVDIINVAIPNIMLVAVGVLLFLLVVGLFKVNAGDLADVGYSFITLILLNIWVVNAFNEIATFFLIFSVLMVGITLVMGSGQSYAGRLPIIFGITIMMIFHNAVGWNNGLPDYLRFVGDPTFQTLAIGGLVFFFLISLVTREKAPEEPTKIWKLFK